MSGAKEAGKRILGRIPREDRIRAAILFSMILSCLARMICVNRIRPSGAAYLFTALDVLIFAEILMPLGASEAVHNLILKRREAGFHKNAKRIYTSALLHTVAYVIVVLIVWGISARRFSEDFLLGKAGYTTLLWMLPLFALDAFTLLLRGYSDGHYQGAQSAFIIFVRQFIVFILILLWGGRDSLSGNQVARLLRNEEVGYIYDASGIIGLITVAAVIALILYLVFLTGGHHDRHLSRGRDNNKKHESPTGLFYTGAFPFAGSILCFLSFHFAGLLLFGRYYRSGGRQILQSYIWGMYSGIYQSLCLLPYMMIFFLIYNSFRQVRGSVAREDRGDLRIRSMNLSGEAAMICFFFAIFNVLMAPRLLGGLFGVDSVLGRRLIWFGTIPFILCCFGLTTSMLLMMIRCRRQLLLHSLVSLIASAAVMLFVPALNIEKSGIYSLLISGSVYYLLLTLLNYLQLMRFLHYTADIMRVVIMPAGCAAVCGIPVFLLSLLFKLFMPDLLNVVICFILYAFAYFFVICRSGLVTVYTLRRMPLGRYAARIGRKLRFLGE